MKKSTALLLSLVALLTSQSVVAMLFSEDYNFDGARLKVFATDHEGREEIVFIKDLAKDFCNTSEDKISLSKCKTESEGKIIIFSFKLHSKLSDKVKEYRKKLTKPSHMFSSETDVVSEESVTCEFDKVTVAESSVDVENEMGVPCNSIVKALSMESHDSPDYISSEEKSRVSTNTVVTENHGLAQDAVALSSFGKNARYSSFRRKSHISTIELKVYLCEDRAFIYKYGFLNNIDIHSSIKKKVDELSYILINDLLKNNTIVGSYYEEVWRIFCESTKSMGVGMKTMLIFFFTELHIKPVQGLVVYNVIHYFVESMWSQIGKVKLYQSVLSNTDIENEGGVCKEVDVACAVMSLYDFHEAIKKDKKVYGFWYALLSKKPTALLNFVDE